jgi:hypothetical protein
MIGITAVHLSRLEASSDPLPDAGRDRIVRVIFRILSGDKNILTIEKFAQWITSVSGAPGNERIVATRKRKWVVTPMAA